MPPIKANLVIRPEKLGDLVVATPVFRAFKETFPNQPLHLLTDDLFAEAVRHDPHLDKIITCRWRGKLAPQRDSWRTIYGSLRSQRYERAAIIYYNCEGWNALMAALRVPHVAQLGGTYSSYLFGHQRLLRKGNAERLHYGAFYLRVAALLGAKASSDLPNLYLTPGESVAIIKRFPFLQERKRRIIVHPFGHGSAPNCSLGAYARLMELLAGDANTEVFVTGTLQEKRLWEEYRHLPIRTDWIGTLSIREWMAAVHEVDLMIGGATGTTHVAGALGTQTLALYCPHVGTHPDVWGPRGPHVQICMVPENQCRAIQPCDSACTADVKCDLSFFLKPEMVAEKARSILASKPTGLR